MPAPSLQWSQNGYAFNSWFTSLSTIIDDEPKILPVNLGDFPLKVFFTSSESSQISGTRISYSNGVCLVINQKRVSMSVIRTANNKRLYFMQSWYNGVSSPRLASLVLSTLKNPFTGTVTLNVPNRPPLGGTFT